MNRKPSEMTSNIKDRIKELRRVPATSLLPNPKNWRTHPKAQQDALAGMLAEVGMVDACIARELPDGSLMLIDGHMRTKTAADAQVPVLILDVTEAEADKIMATLDPLAAMAETNAVALDALLRDMDTGSEWLKKMCADLSESAGILDPTFASQIEPSEAKGADTERDYSASSIRQIVLVFEQDQYESIVEAMGEHAEKFGLANNTEVFVHLLETNGYGISRRDPA